MLIEFIYEKTGIYLFYSRLFSTAVATVFSFISAIIFFPPYIRLLRKVGSSSELNHIDEKPEPVMPGGLLMLVIVAASSLLTVRFNSYVISSLIIYTFFSIIGALDDIAKVINKRKLQKGLISKAEYQYKSDGLSVGSRLFLYISISFLVALIAYKYIPNITGHFVLPFFSSVKHFPYLPFWFFIPIMTITIAVMANGVNFTDGLDTLASVPLITSLIFIGIISYVLSNEAWSRYLLLPYIRGVEELLPLCGSCIGVLLAFLWFNSPPSTIIMGDCGAVGMGGLVGIMFIFIKAWFFLPLVGFIFILEFVSDILQIASFKLTGKRIFLCAPIHHHFLLKMKKKYSGCNDFYWKAKITWRFHIISVICLVIGLIIFLKVR